MLIDCDTCIARGPACGDCVVTAFLAISPPAARPPRPAPARTAIDLDGAERDAVDTLAAAGLIPPLRLVSAISMNAQEIA